MQPLDQIFSYGNYCKMRNSILPIIYCEYITEFIQCSESESVGYNQNDIGVNIHSKYIRNFF